MIDSREPLHQPPNPEDLRRAPPAGPDCARVRGWLRDYVDGDLEAPRTRELEEHVHRCRLCNVELARAEHELLRVRQAFRGLRADQPTLPADFAARVVERLVVDETSLVTAETLDRAAAARTQAVAAEAAGSVRTAASARRAFRPGVALVAAIAMLLMVGVGLELMRGPGRGPDCSAKLYLLSADGAYHLEHRLGRGAWLGERQSLRVRTGGGAQVEWHDRSARPQPAATLQIHGDGEVRLENGSPMLVGGTIDVDTRRGVSIPLGDGSRVDLGIGQYTITAQGGLDPQNPMLAAPEDLFVTIEVRSGEAASVVRAGASPTHVLAGQLGIYQGSSEMTVTSAAGGQHRQDTHADRAPVGAAPRTQHVLLGQARDQFGLPIEGGQVVLLYRSGGTQFAETRTDAQGGFLCDIAAPAEGSHVLALARPPQHRQDLGLFAPDAVPLVRAGDAAWLPSPIVFPSSIPFAGSVRDVFGLPISEVQVVPCIVDEVFGTVWLLGEERSISDDNGSFRVHRLPGRLPAQQSLYLVLFHEQLGSATVAIPPRGSPAAELPFPPITMTPLRHVRIAGLPPHQPLHLIEEIPGLPRGTGVSRQVYPEGLAGTGGWVLVGRGELSVVDPETRMVRALEREPGTAVEQYRPKLDAPLPWVTRFRDVQPLSGTSLEVVHSHRHQNAFQGVPSSAAGRTVSVLDVAGNPIPGAQVFVTDGLAPAALHAARFVGITAPNGLVGWPEVGGSHVFALAADGRVGSQAFAAASGGNVTVEVPACGRVSLGPARRPGPNEAPIVPLRFEPVGGDPELRGPAAVRFATAPQWDVRDLPPGEYRVVIGNSAAQVSVPANGGFVELQ